MIRLIAGIEGELLRRAWNAVDRSEPTKWRRTVPECATHWAVSFHHPGPQRRPKCVRIGPERPVLAAFRLSRGCHVGYEVFAEQWQAGASMLRPPRLAAYPQVRRPMTPARACRARVWDHTVGFKAFLQVFFALSGYSALVRWRGGLAKLWMTS